MDASRTRSAQIRGYLVATFFLALAACGGGSSPSTYSLSGSVSGLTSSGLVLSVDGRAVTVASGATGVSLAGDLRPGFAYAVTVQTQPSGQNCSVANGTGVIASADVGTIAVNCTVAYTVGGSISGLATAGLVLLNNGADATPIPANATQFSMQTKLAPGTSYSITVGSQPNGIRLACTLAGASGTVGADVTTVAVHCAAVTPSQRPIASAFAYASGVAVDATGNVFVADSATDVLEEIPYVAGRYGAPVVIASGFIEPGSVAVDAAGDVFVADFGSGAVKKVPFADGKYGAPVVIASGFDQGPGSPDYTYPFSIAVRAAGTVFVADSGNDTVYEIPYAAGAYGTPAVIGSGFNSPQGLAVDAAGNLYVADTGNHAVKKIPFGGGYGAPVTIASGTAIHNPYSVAVDTTGNVFVVDFPYTVDADGEVTEIPLTAGGYGTPVVIGSGFVADGDLGGAQYVAVDAHGNVFLTFVNFVNYDAGYSPISAGVREIPYGSGGYGAPAVFGTVLIQPYGVVVDAAGNVFVTDTGNGTLNEFPYRDGTYGAPVVIAGGFNGPHGVAVDAAGNVFVADSGNDTVKEVPSNAGRYATPVVIGTGFHQPEGLAVDVHGNVYVTDLDSVTEIPLSAGIYAAPKVIQSGYGGFNGSPEGIAVAANGDLYVAFSSIPALAGISASGATFAFLPLSAAVAIFVPRGVAVDSNGNAFVAVDTGPSTFGQVQEIPDFGPASLAASPNGGAEPVGGYLVGPTGVAVDGNGRLYVVTQGGVFKFEP